MRLPNEIIGKILRSPHHYAKIKSIDTSKVEALPGVLAVATGADAPNTFGVLPVTKDEHAMAVEKVRHVGDLVACVAAVDEATAMEALNLFEIEWEVLDPVFDPRKGLEDQDEPIHWRGKYHVGTTNVQNACSKNLVIAVSSMIQPPHRMENGVWKEFIMDLRSLMPLLHIGTQTVVCNCTRLNKYLTTHIEPCRRCSKFQCIKSM